MLVIVLVGVLGALGVSYAGLVPYRPNEKLINEIGVRKAEQLLKDTVSRSLNPQVVEVEVTDDFLFYRYRQKIAGFDTGALLENRVHFLNVSKVQVFTNHLIIVRTANEVVLAQMLFANAETAQTFADLLMSFRARKSRS
jgi:hypothetical protein